MKFWFLIGNFIKKKIFSKAFLVLNLVIILILAASIFLPTYFLNKKNNSYLNKQSPVIYILTDLKLDNNQQKVIIKKIEQVIPKTKQLATIAFVKEVNSDYDVLINITATSTDKPWHITVTSASDNKLTKNLKHSLVHIHLHDNPYQNTVEITKSQELDKKHLRQQIVVGLINAFVIACVIAASVFGSIVGSDVVNDKSSKVIEQILMNIKVTHYFTAKILAAVIYAILQTFIMIAIAVLMLFISRLISFNSLPQFIALFELDMPILFMSLSLLLIIFTTCCISTIIAAITASSEEFSQVMGVLNFLLLILFYASMAYGGSSNLEGYNLISQILSYLPVTGLMIAPISLLNGVTLWHETLVATLLQITYIGYFIYFLFPKFKQFLLNYKVQQNIWRRIFKPVFKHSKNK